MSVQTPAAIVMMAASFAAVPARACVERTRWSMANCAEKDVFDKALRQCNVQNEAQLADVVCAITYWASYVNEGVGYVPPCPQCCVYLGLLTSLTAGRTDCPGARALAAMTKASGCEQIRQLNGGSLLSNLDCPESSAARCGAGGWAVGP